MQNSFTNREIEFFEIEQSSLLRNLHQQTIRLDFGTTIDVSTTGIARGEISLRLFPAL